MSCVVYLTNKKSGYMYAYESESYRDPITRKPKSRRSFIGRVDPVTKELLDPEKARRLKEKKERSSGKATVQEETNLKPLDSTLSSEEVIEELRQVKEILLQERDELRRIQNEQDHTRETVLTVVKLIQDSFVSS